MEARKRSKWLPVDGQFGEDGRVEWPAEWPPLHPKANRTAMLDSSKFAALVRSIEALGQQETIKFLRGKLLEGRNRYRACMQLGIEPRIEHLPDDTDAEAYVTAANLMRRHSTMTQQIATVMLGHRGKPSQQQIADKVGCQQAQVSRVNKAADKAVTIGMARTMTEALSMLAYGHVTEGKLRTMRIGDVPKANAITPVDEARSKALTRLYRELKEILEHTPEDHREPFTDGVHAAVDMQTRYSVSPADVKQAINSLALRDEDADEEEVDDEVEGEPYDVKVYGAYPDDDEGDA